MIYSFDLYFRYTFTMVQKFIQLLFNGYCRYIFDPGGDQQLKLCFLKYLPGLSTYRFLRGRV